MYFMSNTCNVNQFRDFFSKIFSCFEMIRGGIRDANFKSTQDKIFSQ
uniref:Uncharacterized protein n=1 Tax=Lepeophtheirus salmonis TaxID=72036 RepID=A0A0K2T7R8_LEPSM